MKLIGNSGYGSLLMENVNYVRGENNAEDKVKSPRFKAMTELGGDMFEVQSNSLC